MFWCLTLCPLLVCLNLTASRNALRSFGSVADKVAMFNKATDSHPPPVRRNFSRLRTARSMEQLRSLPGDESQPNTPTKSSTALVYQNVSLATSQPDLATTATQPDHAMSSTASQAHQAKSRAPPLVKRKAAQQVLKRCQSTPEDLAQASLADDQTRQDLVLSSLAGKSSSVHKAEGEVMQTSLSSHKNVSYKTSKQADWPVRPTRQTDGPSCTQTDEHSSTQTDGPSSMQTDGPSRAPGASISASPALPTSSIAIVAPVSRIPQRRKDMSPIHKKATRVNSRDSGYLDDASETSSTNGSPERTSPLTPAVTNSTDCVFVSPTKYPRGLSVPAITSHAVVSK